MKILPTLASLPAGTTKGDLIDLLNPQVTFDTALPQDWVNHITKMGFDPRGQVVWSYPKGTVFGLPMPLTQEARTALIGLNQHIWDVVRRDQFRPPQ